MSTETASAESAPSAPTPAPTSAAPASTSPSPTTSKSVTTAVNDQITDSVTSSSPDWLSSIDEAIKTGVASEKQEQVTDEQGDTESQLTEEKTVEEADEDEAEPIPNMTKAAGAKFKQLKSDLKTWKQKAAELEKQIAERPAQVPEDYEQLKAQLAEYEQEISVSRVEASTQFKQAVIEPLNGVLSAAYSMASKYQVPENTMEAMLQEQDPAKQDELLQELASGFSERDRLNLYRLVDDVGVILHRRGEILNNAALARETIAQQAHEQFVTENKQAYENVWKALSDKVPLFSDKTIAEDVRTKAMGANLLEAKPDIRAYAAYSGAMLPHLLKQNQTLTAKIAELEKTITGFRKTVPKAGKGHSVQTERPSDMGFLEALEAQL